jgi:glutamate synthase (NADPH/NADH) small chain
MGKPTGFMEWQRLLPKKRDAAARLGDFAELAPLHDHAEASRQAGRCMDCGVPFCHQGCPLGNLIPDFNDHVHRGAWRAAYEVLSSTNDFPEWTGRLCPAPCEASCVLAIDREPVTIEETEKAIAERAFAEGWVQPRSIPHRTGKRVAVVGSGPAGLAAAAQLNLAGHDVVVLERDDAIGGLLRYGIPDFKLEKRFVDRRLAVLEAEGVRFETGVDVGRGRSWADLARDHDAIVLALGARRPRDLDVEGRDLDGVVQAMEFLEAQNRVVAGGAPASRRLDVRGRRVIILGGGDTGSDCLGTALRLEAASVAQVELMPAPPAARAPGNPWPQWPMVFRTSSSQEEGGARAFGKRTLRLEGDAGVLRALVWTDVRLEAGSDGRARLVDVLGTEERVEVDRLVLAMGFVGPELGDLEGELGVDLDARGNVKVDAGFRTTSPKVWAAGDVMRGASLIVWAIADGREAARSVDHALMGRPSALPTRGRDQPWPGR